MSDFEHDALRDLMVRATEDLVAPRAAAARAIRRQRRRRARVRILGAAGTAAAAGLAVGVLVPAGGKPHSPASSSLPPVRLTAAQRTLFSLSAIAAATPRPEGRYVVLTEQAISVDSNGTATPTREAGGKTSVIDTLTGGGLQYQDISVTNPDGTPLPPGTLTARPGTSPTRAQLDAIPTGTAALRAYLLAQARQQQEQALQFMEQQREKLGKGKKPGAYPSPRVKQPPETADDLVFEQAADLLWEPHLSPALRSALYKVLAATPGVIVRTGAHDSSGHPATEISRLNSVARDDAEVFVDPVTGATRESAWVGPGVSLAEDLYLSVRYTGTIPPDPYRH
jgi:hypothetical protein